MHPSPYDQPYRGGFVGKQHRFALTVFFEDTDTAGIVYYANYLKFMERARSDMLRAAGIDQRAAKEDGTGVYAVAEVGIKYVRPPSSATIFWSCPPCSKFGRQALSFISEVMRGVRTIGRCPRHRSLPRSPRPAEAPAALMGREIQCDQRGLMPELTATPDLMSPLNLFMQADVVVKAVMLGLLLASVWTWAIIFTHSIRLKQINRGTDKFEQDFWATNDIDAFHGQRGSERCRLRRSCPRRSTNGADRPRPSRSIAPEPANASPADERRRCDGVDRLSDRLNILATVGSVAPFVGLFGTVWGIMRSFTAIAGANNTSLAVVAPGIAEALFATAIGLFAAIPAVIAYNRLTQASTGWKPAQPLRRPLPCATLSRELEVEVATGH